jgi:hypothetical protein
MDNLIRRDSEAGPDSESPAKVSTVTGLSPSPGPGRRPGAHDHGCPGRTIATDLSDQAVLISCLH